MVKNVHGGKKHKSGAASDLSLLNKKALYLPKIENQRIAQVTKIFGGSRIQVHDDHANEFIAVIRGKFKGRKRRDNSITVGCLVCIEVEGGGCDVVHVYSDTNRMQLMNLLHRVDWARFTSGDLVDGTAAATSSSSSSWKHDTAVLFTNEVEPQPCFRPPTTTTTTFLGDDEEYGERVDVDDL